MENVQEKISLLESLFKKVTGTPPNIRFEDGFIYIAEGQWSIEDTEMEVKSIGRTLKVPAFALSKAVYIPGSDISPPDVSVVELTVERKFEQIAKAAVIAVVEALLDAYLDFLDTEAQAKELFG